MHFNLEEITEEKEEENAEEKKEVKEKEKTTRKETDGRPPIDIFEIQKDERPKCASKPGSH